MTISVKKYKLRHCKEDRTYRVYYSEVNELRCPKCRSPLIYRDSRQRLMRKEGGEKVYLKISRMRCPKCEEYHTILPDCLMENKHYEADVIRGVQEGCVVPEDAEDYPSMSSMRRWKSLDE